MNIRIKEIREEIEEVHLVKILHLRYTFVYWSLCENPIFPTIFQSKYFIWALNAHFATLKAHWVALRAPCLALRVHSLAMKANCAHLGFLIKSDIPTITHRQTKTLRE